MLTVIPDGVFHLFCLRLSADDVTARTRYGLLALGTLAYAGLMFTWFSVPAFLDLLVAAFGLSSTQAGLLEGAIPLTYVPIALFSGGITDRVGPYRAISVGLVLIAGGQLGRASVHSFAAFLALTVVIGIGGTTITFGLPKLVSNLFPPSEAGTPSSVYVVGSLAGTAAAFSLGRDVLGPVLGGWRPLFLLTGVVILVFAVCWWIVVSAAPVYAIQYQAVDTDDTDADSDDADISVAALHRNVSQVFVNPSMRLLVAIGVVYLMTLHTFQNWLPQMLGARGVAPGLAATLTSGFVVTEAVGTLGVPPLSDRLGARGTVVAACAGLCAVGTMALLVPSVPLAVPLFGALLVGLGVGGISPLVRMIPSELDAVGPELTGTAVGLVFAIGEFGGFLGPFLVGNLHDLTGTYAAGFAVVALCCLGAVVAGLRLPA